jgi:hypothetical protein
MTFHDANMPYNPKFHDDYIKALYQSMEKYHNQCQ